MVGKLISGTYISPVTHDHRVHNCTCNSSTTLITTATTVIVLLNTNDSSKNEKTCNVSLSKYDYYFYSQTLKTLFEQSHILYTLVFRIMSMMTRIYQPCVNDNRELLHNICINARIIKCSTIKCVDLHFKIFRNKHFNWLNFKYQKYFLQKSREWYLLYYLNDNIIVLQNGDYFLTRYTQSIRSARLYF